MSPNNCLIYDIGLQKMLVLAAFQYEMFGCLNYSKIFWQIVEVLKSSELRISWLSQLQSLSNSEIVSICFHLVHGTSALPLRYPAEKFKT